MRRATVYYQDKHAGILSQGDDRYRFVYTEEYLQDPDARPISLTLPLRAEAYESDHLFPFFEGLVPEGWYLDIVSKTLKIDKSDRFGLLLTSGEDSIGAVRVVA